MHFTFVRRLVHVPLIEVMNIICPLKLNEGDALMRTRFDCRFDKRLDGVLKTRHPYCNWKEMPISQVYGTRGRCMGLQLERDANITRDMVPGKGVWDCNSKGMPISLGMWYQLKEGVIKKCSDI